MRRGAIVLLAGTAVCGALALTAPGARATCPAAASSGSVGTMTLVSQTNATSCWAASGEMVSKRLGKTCSQCAQLSAGCSLCASSGCCSPLAGTCEKGGFVDWDRCGFSFDRTPDGVALAWADLIDQLGCKKAPVTFAWHWVASWSAGGVGGGHMMVAARYKTSRGRQVYVYDPDPVGEGETLWMPYSVYIEGADHTHWSDDHNIARK